MIGKGSCLVCGRRFEDDADRPNDGREHDDCKKYSNILKNLGISKEGLRMVLEHEGILTTSNYWDCECLVSFIHPRVQNKCPKCGAFAKEQPDSRVSEVLAAGLPLEKSSD